jgi:hypothetical protein
MECRHSFVIRNIHYVKLDEISFVATLRTHLFLLTSAITALLTPSIIYKIDSGLLLRACSDAKNSRFAPRSSKCFETNPEAAAMPILMDQILSEYVDEAVETSRLRRNSASKTRDLISAEMLAGLEASGQAMRFVDTNGRITWKATPSLRQHLKDLELDAQADLQDV